MLALDPFISTLAEKLCSPNHDRKLGLHQYQDAKQKLAAFTHKHLSSLATELKIPIDAVETIAPCTPLQEGMIYRCLHSEGGAYLSSFLFKLEPNVNGSHLMGSWQKVQHFVQILRTKFPVTSDGYAQVVLKKDIFPWFELNTTEDDDVFSLAEKRYSRWSSELRQFTDRLWEAGLVSGPTTRLMCLNIFHGIYDGNSLPLLLEKVAQAYFDQGIFETPSYIDVLPHGPLCIRPDAQSFWTQHLQNADANTLPSNGDSSRNRPHFLTVDLTALERLEQVRRDLNVTKLAVIHACWLDVFQRNFGFVPTIGIVTSGRALDYKNADDVIGPLFNTLPSYIPFSNSTSVAELIQTCHNFHVNTLPYQHTPLRDIMKWTGRNADNPLFDTIFVYQKENTNLSRLSKILWTPAESHAEADYPLAIEITDRENGSLAATIVAKSHVLSFEAAERILNEFKNQVTQFSDTETISTRTVGHVLPITGTQLNANFSQEGPPHKHQSKISTSHFRWSSKAKQIRQEIARLANIEEGVVTETTSILELGLDSIDAIKLSSRLKALSITLSVSKIMHCRTIQAMVNEIVSRPEPNDDHHGTLSVIENTLRASLKDDDVDFSNIERVLPATPLQEGMIAEMIASDYRHYFNHDILELEADLNIDKLRVAFTKLIELTPILRTSFIQVSDPELPFSFAQLVHSQNPNVCWTETEIIAKSIDSILEEERVSAASDGLQSPLFRLRLLRERSRKLLLISIAHALYDGWSLDLMHQAIKTSYHGGNLNSPSYHRVLERVVRTANDENCSRFWRGYLENVKPVPFPKRTASDVPQVHRCERELNVPSSSILTFCKSQAITPQALGLTSWMMVLAGCTGQLDVVLGTIMLGRDTPDEENVIFPTMNSVAIRGILHGSRHEMLQYVQGMLSGIRENQHFPLRKVKGLLKIGNQTIFDTLFIYQKRPNAGDLQLYKSIMSSADVEYPVCVEMEISGDSILWRVACKSMVMSKSDTDNLIDQIEACFTEITSNPDAPTVMFNGEAASVCGVTLSASTASSDDTRLAEKGSAVSGSWAPLELAIRTVLSSVSGVPEQNITKDTTLFHIGLDSISAIKVSGLLKKQSIILAVSNMLRAGTVERMAESAKMLCPKDEKLNSRSTSMSLVSDIDAQALLSLNNIHQINVENVVPATPGQIYMIEMWKQSNGLLFFPNFFYTFKGYVTPQRLEESWEQVITKLPILRTEILATGRPDTRYMQVILRSSNNPIIWQKDLSSLLGPGHSAVKKGSKWVTLYASQTDSATVVMLHIHHALYDAVSLGHLVDMLSRGCHGKLNQDGVDADLAHYIGFSSINSSPEIRKAFWTKHLAKAPLQDRKNELCTPIERRAMTNDYRTSFVPDIGALVKVGRSHGISIQSIFLAAYAKTHMKLVSRPSQTETLVIGLYLANRSHDLEALPDLAAPTLNIVPLCIQNIGRPVLHLAQSIQSDVSDISNAQNSCVSLYEVAEWSGVVIDTVVNFLRFPDSTEEGEGRLSRFVPLKEPAIAQKPASSTQTIVKPDGTSVDLKTSFPGLFHSLQDEERSRRIFRVSAQILAILPLLSC